MTSRSLPRPSRCSLVVCALLCLAAACGGSSTSAEPATTNGQIVTADDQADGEGTPETRAPNHPCTRLTNDLCRDLDPEGEACALVRERTAELPEAHCDALLAHYDEVLDDLRAQVARYQPLSSEQQARAVQGATTTQGPDTARVTIVLFSDFQCPYCAGAAIATHDVIQHYGDRVRVVFRNFPLSFHAQAHVAAEAALAAHAQGKFWAMHDLLFAHQDQLDREGLRQHAGQLQLDVPAFELALDQQTYAAAVDADFRLGVELGVNATPTMFINGIRVPNASDVELVRAKIDALLASPEAQ